MNEFLNRRFWVFYPLWILLCALLFVALRDAEDPSRPGERIHNDEASRRAIAELRRADPQRFADFTVVNVAYARPQETGKPAHWIVLADRRDRTALRDAVVVELDAVTGKLITIRKVIQ